MRRPVVLGLAAALLAGSASVAEQAGDEKDFTFRRVKVGAPGASGKRILVQIDPAEQSRILKINPAVPAAPETPIVVARPDGSLKPVQPAQGAGGASRPVPNASYAWFWNLVSPELALSRSGRMETAVAALRNGPDGAAVRAPRLSTLQRIADTHGAEILKATVGTKVSPALVLAVIAVESAGRPAAVSSAGAAGLMQLMPATAARFGVTDRTNAAQNIRGGVVYLDWLLDHFERDPIMALAGYNAGENAVRSNAGVPPYSETRDYVPKVIAAWNVATGLCLTPPQLVSDGCVFRRGMQTASVTD